MKQSNNDIKQEDDIKLYLSIWQKFAILWNPAEKIKEGSGKEDYIHIDIFDSKDILDKIDENDSEANDGIDDDMALFMCRYRKDE